MRANIWVGFVRVREFPFGRDPGGDLFSGEVRSVFLGIHWDQWVGGLVSFGLGAMFLAAAAGYGLGHTNPFAAALAGWVFMLYGVVGLAGSWWCGRTRSEGNR